MAGVDTGEVQSMGASELQRALDRLRRETVELRRSRARLLLTNDADRRAIERTLHDGLQQELVALAVNLRRAAALLEEDPTQRRDCWTS